MRKLLLITVCLVTTGTIAQKLSIYNVCGSDRNPEGGELKRGTIKRYAGTDGEHIYTLIYENPFNEQLRTYIRCNNISDGKTTYIKEFKFPGHENKVEENSITASYQNGTFAMMWQESKGKTVSAYTCHIDAKNPANVSAPELLFEAISPAYTYHYEDTVSQNKDYYLLYQDDWINLKKGPRPCRFVILDKLLNPVKKIERMMSFDREKSLMASTKIDNNGNPCFIFQITLDNKTTKYQYLYYDRLSDKTYEGDLDMGVTTVINFTSEFDDENHLVIAGTYSDTPRKDFKKGYAQNLSGFFYKKLDLVSKKTWFDHKQPIDENMISTLRSSQSLVMYQPNLSIAFDSSKHIYFTFEQVDRIGIGSDAYAGHLNLIVNKLTDHGSVKWSKLIPKYQLVSNGFNLYPLDNDVFIVYCDHKDNLDKDYADKILKHNNDAIVIAVTIKDDGTMKKEKIYDEALEVLGMNIIYGDENSFIIGHFHEGCFFTKILINK